MGLAETRSQQVGQLGRFGMGWMATISNSRVGYEFDIKSDSTFIRGTKMAGLLI